MHAIPPRHLAPLVVNLMCTSNYITCAPFFSSTQSGTGHRLLSCSVSDELLSDAMNLLVSPGSAASSLCMVSGSHVLCVCVETCCLDPFTLNVVLLCVLEQLYHCRRTPVGKETLQ